MLKASPKLCFKQTKNINNVCRRSVFYFATERYNYCREYLFKTRLSHLLRKMNANYTDNRSNKCKVVLFTYGRNTRHEIDKIENFKHIFR